jgi:O-6-methylguanine DNA methyltransferase
MNNALMISAIPTMLGSFRATISERGLVALGFPDSDPAEDLHWRARWFPNAREDAVYPLAEQIETQLNEYLRGERLDFTLPLDPQGTDFQKRCWQALCAIPYGQTRSYSEQAQLLGHVNAARAVGAANGANRIPIIIPCHRLIGKNQSLVHYAGGLALKQYLLQHEGTILATKTS